MVATHHFAPYMHPTFSGSAAGCFFCSNKNGLPNFFMPVRRNTGPVPNRNPDQPSRSGENTQAGSIRHHCDEAKKTIRQGFNLHGNI
jgi:hypothetical protein